MAKPQRLFLSYARADDEPDEPFVKRLYADLTNRGFNVWWDRVSMPSRALTFLQEIRDAIEACDRLLAVIGPQAVKSDYVQAEWQHGLLFAKGVVPIMRLGERQLLPPELRKLHCPDFREKRPYEEALEELLRILAEPIPELGPLLTMVPSLPPHFLLRQEDFNRLKDMVLADVQRPTVVTSAQQVTGLWSMGGSGKSVLAAALARATDTRRPFLNGILWVTVGQEGDPLQQLRRVGMAFGDKEDKPHHFPDLEAARNQLPQVLADKVCLIVLDDVWKMEQVEPLVNALGPRCRLLITTREAGLVTDLGAQELPLGELSDADALKLLAAWKKLQVKDLPSEAREVAQACGKLPLALSLCGSMAGGGISWSDLRDALRDADLTYIEARLPNYPFPNVFKAIQLSVDFLEKENPGWAEHYRELAVFPASDAVPEEAVVTLWQHADSLKERDARKLLAALDRKALLKLQGQEPQRLVTLHDLQHDYLRALAGEGLSSLHERLLAAYREKCTDGWPTGPNDGYFYKRLAQHLKDVGRVEELRCLLLDLDWLRAKLKTGGIPSLMSDYELLANDHADSGIGSVHRACRRAAHILTNDPSQLAAQLLARLDPTSPLELLLEKARAWRNGPWLRPVTPSLGEEGEPTLAVFRGREKDGHAGTPRTIALSSDGSLMASGGGSSNDLTVKVWSVGDVLLLRTYPGAVEAGGATGLAFVGKDGRFAAVSRDEVHLYAFNADDPIAWRKFDGAYISQICGSDWNSIVFIGFADGRVLAWDPATDTTMGLREPEGDGVIALAHASASPRLAIATAAVVECLDGQNGQLIGRLEEELGYGMVVFKSPPLAITANGSQVFFGNPARSWTVGEPEAKALMENINAGLVVGLSDDGAVALTAPEEQELVTIEVGTGRRTCRIRNSCKFSCLALARNGCVVATGDFEHDVKIWDLTRVGTDLAEWQNRGPVRSVAVCDDNSLAIVATDDRCELWDTVTGAPLEIQGQLTSNRVVRRSKSLLDQKICQEVRARLEEVLTKGEMNHFSVPVRVLEFSKKAGRAISAPRISGKPADMEEPPYDRIDVSAGYPLQLWDLKSIHRPQLLYGHTMPITCANITEDGTRALTGSWGRLLRLWDLDTGDCLKILRGHRGIVFGCALTEDARFAVSGSEDMTVRLWDLPSGKLLFTFATSSAVKSCDISRDGAVAIAGEVSGRVHMFWVED